MASPPLRFAVRWPVPYSGPSFIWRLIFSVPFPSREKEQNPARQSVTKSFKNILKNISFISKFFVFLQSIFEPYSEIGFCN